MKIPSCSRVVTLEFVQSCENSPERGVTDGMRLDYVSDIAWRELRSTAKIVLRALLAVTTGLSRNGQSPSPQRDGHETESVYGRADHRDFARRPRRRAAIFAASTGSLAPLFTNGTPSRAA
jgi:hypothetical protein